MKTYKRIDYCYPSSHNSELLSEHDEGGFYVATAVRREDGTLSSFKPALLGDGLFQSATDETLLSLFAEAPGEVL